MMARRFAFLALMSLAFSFCTTPLQARSLPDPFIRSTVFIINKSAGTSGTGFLVRRIVNKEGRFRLALISNKHVLMPGSIAANIPDKKAEAIVSMNVTTESGVTRKDITVVLRTVEGRILVTQHPESNVDVAGLELPPQTVFPGENTVDASKLNIISEDRIMTLR